MKAHLLFPTDGTAGQEQARPLADDLVADLELGWLFDAMAAEDPYLRQVSEEVMLGSVVDRAVLLYRQSILRDTTEHIEVMKTLYSIAVDAIEGEKKVYSGMFRDRPETVLNRALKVLAVFDTQLVQLRQLADQNADTFTSEGLRTLMGVLRSELTDEFFTRFRDHTARLELHNGMRMSVHLGPGNRGDNYRMLEPPLRPKGLSGLWWRPNGRELSFTIAPRDEAGAAALADLRDRAAALSATVLHRSAGHVLNFFRAIRYEVGFYLAGVNLHQALAQRGVTVTLPEIPETVEPKLSFDDLKDVPLVLRATATVIGNRMNADNTHLTVVTGANSGGKSTFLRSVGVAYLMMHAGLFVAADRFRAGVADGVFTHFSREEDATMGSGRLDDELVRMSAIVDHVRKGSVVLFNESFASTNEREGSEIARQVILTLITNDVRCLVVTHLYDLASSLADKGDGAVFLRADRQENGQRDFRLVEAPPLATSFGQDIYERLGGLTGLPQETR